MAVEDFSQGSLKELQPKNPLKKDLEKYITIVILEFNFNCLFAEPSAVIGKRSNATLSEFHLAVDCIGPRANEVFCFCHGLVCFGMLQYPLHCQFYY